MDKKGRKKEEIPGSKRSMYGYILTYSRLKGRMFKLSVLTRWDFNFCVRSSPLRGIPTETFTLSNGALSQMTRHVSLRQIRLITLT